MPRENGNFKIRENRTKQFSALMKQITGPTEVNVLKYSSIAKRHSFIHIIYMSVFNLYYGIFRCMGLLLCPGTAQSTKAEKLFPMNEV